MPPVHLSAKSIEWAIDSLERHSDTDLFPRPAELKAIFEDRTKAIPRIQSLDLHNYEPSPTRRFIVPKDDLSYRAATQLDPLDSIVLTAMIHEFGQRIEDRRRAISESRVFSYRFQPSVDGKLYSTSHAWNNFWTHCEKMSWKHPTALVLDVADFYNQIYHHVVENQLAASGWPNAAIKVVNKMLIEVTASVSRGIPIGPHPAHLIAEATLIPVDNSFVTQGLNFCRFVDDVVIFAKDESSARVALYQVAGILDKQHRLQLQKSKTRIMEAHEFREYCHLMIEDRPIDDLEKEMLTVIRKYTGGNPYQTVYVNQLTPEDLRAFSEESVQHVLRAYLDDKHVDYSRLRWFLRRLAQVGHPAAIKFCIERFLDLIPAISDVCHYFISVSAGNSILDWEELGDKLLQMFDSPLVRANEYFQMSVLSLFGREPRLDHVARLVGGYPTASQHVRREIILALSAAGGVDWLRERKEEARSMDPWTRRAFMFAAKGLPSDERKHFLTFMQAKGTLEELIVSWAKT